MDKYEDCPFPGIKVDEKEKNKKKNKKLLTSTEDSVVKYIDEGSPRPLAFPVSMQCAIRPSRPVDLWGLTLGAQITIFRYIIGLERLSNVGTGARLSNRKEIFGPPLPHKLSQVCPYKGQDC